MSQQRETDGLDLDAIRARCDAATPGPWVVEFLDGDGTHHIRMGEAISSRHNYRSHLLWECDHGVYPDDDPNYPNTPEMNLQWAEASANAELMAHARSDVPALLADHYRQAAEIELLAAEIERLRGGVGPNHSHRNQQDGIR